MIDVEKHLENFFNQLKATIPKRDDETNPSIENILLRMAYCFNLNPPDTKKFFINNNGRYAWQDMDGNEPQDQTDDPKSIFWQGYRYKEPSVKETSINDNVPERAKWIYEYFIDQIGYIPNDEWYDLNKDEIMKQVDLIYDQCDCDFIRDREFYIRNHYQQTLGDFRYVVKNPD